MDSSMIDFTEESLNDGLADQKINIKLLQNTDPEKKPTIWKMEKVAEKEEVAEKDMAEKKTVDEVDPLDYWSGKL